MVSFSSWALVALAATTSLPTTYAFTSYISQWIRVNYTVEGGWDAVTNTSQQEIVAAADWWNAQGPWSVLNKSYTAPSGDPHDYLSWSPYWWPDCSNVGNTTALTDEQVMTECVYVNRDGQFNPDGRLVNNTGDFQALADAVFYSTIAYKITNNDTYASQAARWLNIWFVNNATAMNPNLEYAQIIRGSQSSGVGAHTGVLDFHHMTKIVSAIIVLKAAGAAAWTSDLETGMQSWCTRYLVWLTTNDIALQEKAATNNHGSFYYSQTASIMIYTGAYDDARKLLNEYWNGIYQDQIVANGDQPLESARTRPYHYRAYNAMAILTINRMTEYMGWNTWNITTAAGTNVQNAVDYAMTIPAGDDDPTELYPVVAATAQHYGDTEGKYAAWLAQQDPTYPGEAFFFWEQPLSDSNLIVHLDPDGSVHTGTATASVSAAGETGSSQSAASPRAGVGAAGVVVAGAVALVAAALL